MRPWLADLGLACGLAYIFVGGAAARILAQAGSSLIDSYHVAPPTDRPAILIAIQLLRDAFVFGVWQTVDPLTAGAWVLSVGWLLLVERLLVGRLLIVLGLWLWAFALLTISGIHSLATLGAVLAVAIGVWLAWVMLERRRLVRAER